MATQHVAITDPDIHEPKGVAAATTGKVYVSNGAGSGAWTSTFALQPSVVTLDIATLNTVGDYYLSFPYACTINKVHSAIDAAIATADKVLTLSIGGVAVTNGVITITNSGSAAGDIDSCTPTAANTLTAGQVLKIAATGASTGDARCHLSIVYTRTA